MPVRQKVCGHQGGHVWLTEVAGSNRLAGLNRNTYAPSVGSLFRCSPDPKLDRSLLGMDVLNRFQIMYANGYMTMRPNQRQALSRAKVEAANGRFFITEVD